MRSTSAFLLGAGASYFFDPSRGKGRRSAFRDRSLRGLRRLQRLATGKVKFAGGHARGLVAVTRRALTRTEVLSDDETVTQRIRSDAFRDVGVSTRDIDVHVENGFVTLRGSVDGHRPRGSPGHAREEGRGRGRRLGGAQGCRVVASNRGIELSDELVALVELGERDGCLTLSEVESVLLALDPEDEIVDELHEELEQRGIEITDDCVRGDAGDGEYSNGELAAATTDSLQLFLNEIGRYPLLTAQEEVELAKRIERGDAARRSE